MQQRVQCDVRRLGQDGHASCKEHVQGGCLGEFSHTSCSMMAAMRRSFSCRGMASGSCSSALVMMVSLTCEHAGHSISSIMPHMPAGWFTATLPATSWLVLFFIPLLTVNL